MRKLWKLYHFEKNSQAFQYSERTITSTETNDPSTESSDTQLFGAGRSKGVALSGGLHAHLSQKEIESKGKFNGAKDAKKKLIAPSLFLYYDLSVCPLILNSNKVYFGSSLITKPTEDAQWSKPLHIPTFN